MCWWSFLTDTASQAPPRVLRVALAGNRNVGKSTIFNRLTGLRQRVGNFPGVTVERLEGVLRGSAGREALVTDLPGTNSLVARSTDEAIVAGLLTGDQEGAEEPDVVAVVLDATQLRRGLFFLSQVMECGRPVVVCLNMADEARREGVHVDPEVLSRALGGIPVVETVGVRGTGFNELVDALFRAAGGGQEPPLPQVPGVHGLPAPSGRRWRMLREVVGEAGLEESETLARWRWVRSVERALDMERFQARRARSDRVDRFLLHPVLGPLVFVLVMGAMFQAVFALAATPMEWIDAGFAAIAQAAAATLPGGILTDFLTDGVIAGVGAVLVFLPQILILFFFLGLLEDTGYLTRAAFIVDAPLRRVGLSGRSFVPLLTSFACAVPGVMAARTIADRRERFTTVMVAPLMTCSARLPVYALLIGTFVPERTLLGFVGLQGLVLLGLYLGGMVLAAGAALVIDRLSRSARQPMVMELPPFRMPRGSMILQRLRHRCGVFLKRAGTIILLMAVVMWGLLNIPVGGGSQGAGAGTEASLAGVMGHAMEPVVEPLGFDWRIGVGILGSFAAREVFLSTMAVVYAVEEDAARLGEAMSGARWRRTGQEVYSLPTVVALLVFYMVALQCMSTMAVVRRELGGWRWALLQWLWMAVLAWGLAWGAHRVTAMITG